MNGWQYVIVITAGVAGVAFMWSVIGIFLLIGELNHLRQQIQDADERFWDFRREVWKRA